MRLPDEQAGWMCNWCDMCLFVVVCVFEFSCAFFCACLCLFVLCLFRTMSSAVVVIGRNTIYAESASFRKSVPDDVSRISLVA